MHRVELYNQNIKLREVSWSKIYRRSFIEQHHLRCAKGLLQEDNEFSYRLYSVASQTRHVDLTPYVCRVSQTSATKKRISLINMESDLLVANVLYDDIFMKKSVIIDSEMIQEIKQFIRYEIARVFQNFHLLNKDEQKIAKRKMQKYITWRMLPYMSKKKFILLHFGIVR